MGAKIKQYGYTTLWALSMIVCLSIAWTSAYNGNIHKELTVLSGGTENLDKRFRPSYGKHAKIIKYEDVEKQARWVAEEAQMMLREQLYLFGSWSNDSWWMNSDIDLGLRRSITEADKERIEYLSKKFKVNIELRELDERNVYVIPVEIITF